MAYIWTYTRAAVLRNRYRTLAMLLGIVLAVGLLSAALFYVDASAAHMTQTAVANVPVDMQIVATSPDTSLDALQNQIAAQPGVTHTALFSLSHFDGGQLTGGSRATATTAGALIAIQPDYLTIFGKPTIVQGQFSADGVLISKDMATNLGAKPGDTIQLNFSSPIPPFVTHVTGIADLSGLDLLFAPTDAQHRQQAFNPPANVVIMDLGVFNAQLRSTLLSTQPASTDNPVVNANAAAINEQLHIQINRAGLAGDPIQAQLDTEQLRRQIERQAPGQISAINNLNDAIEAVKGDVLWAKILVVFLAGPGVLLAAYLSRYATARLIAGQRQELALLRARGATPKQIVILVTAISGVIALVGVVIGIVLGLGTSVLTFSDQIINAGNAPLLLRSVLVSLGAGALFALVVSIVPTRSLYLAEVKAGRRQAVLETVYPLWQRLYLDVLCFAAGLITLAVTQQNGFAPVVNGEGNATLSLSLFTFLSPTLIWVGTALLLLRLSGRLLKATGGGVIWFLRTIFGSAGEFAARGLARRSSSALQVSLMITLAVAFGISLSGFAATYRQQQRVDAELTLGADVRITPDRSTPQNAILADMLKSQPGVASVSPFNMTVGYVGSELQDLFGVEVFSLRQTATLSDVFFLDAPADTVLSRLASTPDGIVISEETAKDYGVVAGDHINIRLQRLDGQFITVQFQIVGVAREFPTAPKDSFLVANQAFLQQQLGTPNVSTFLIRASADPAQVANMLRSQFPESSFKIQSIQDVTAQLSSTLTTVSLEGLTRIEWAYTLLIAALALMIFLLTLLAERETEYATLAAVGATPGQVNAFVLSEALVAGGFGIVAGSVVGLVLTQVLVSILTSIFDPPPNAVLIPGGAIVLLLILMATGLSISMLVVITLLRRRIPAQVLRNA